MERWSVGAIGKLRLMCGLNLCILRAVGYCFFILVIVRRYLGDLLGASGPGRGSLHVAQHLYYCSTDSGHLP